MHLEWGARRFVEARWTDGGSTGRAGRESGRRGEEVRQYNIIQVSSGRRTFTTRIHDFINATARARVPRTRYIRAKTHARSTQGRMCSGDMKSRSAGGEGSGAGSGSGRDNKGASDFSPSAGSTSRYVDVGESRNSSRSGGGSSIVGVGSLSSYSASTSTSTSTSMSELSACWGPSAV